MTLQFIIVMIASAINERLQRKLDYLEEERRVLREQLDAVNGGKKLSLAHYHRERFHQGLGGQLIEVKAGAISTKRAQGKVVCRSRLGGVLNYDHRDAA